MGGCVIGAGPSGLYAAKYLAARGIPVSVYEKSGGILGNYKYAKTRGQKMESVLDGGGIALHLNTDASEIDDSACDFYVVATGGTPRMLDIPGGDLAVPGIRVVERHYSGQEPGLGNRICIVGMGNVAFDIVDYVGDHCRDITVLSSRSFLEAPFDNHVLREAIDSGRRSIAVHNAGAAPGSGAAESRRSAGRERLLRRVAGGWWPRLRNCLFGAALNLRFGVTVEELRKKGDGVEVVFSSRDRRFRETFDSVVSSIGFIPNAPQISTEKPVFRTGWCVSARGNIGDAQQGAQAVADDVLEKLYSNRIGA